MPFLWSARSHLLLSPRAAIWLVSALVTQPWAAQGVAADAGVDQPFARSVVSVGDTARLQHVLAKALVTGLLESVRKELPADDKLAAIGPVPPPLFSDLFEHTVLLEAAALKPVQNQGWVLDAVGKCWKSDRPGSRIEFEIEGQAILLMDWHIRGPMGKAKVQVDDRPAVVRDAWFDQTWGGYRQTTELARGLTPGTHRVSFEILSTKNPQSTGKEYRILGLGAAGVAGR